MTIFRLKIPIQGLPINIQSRCSWVEKYLIMVESHDCLELQKSMNLHEIVFCMLLLHITSIHAYICRFAHKLKHVVGLYICLAASQNWMVKNYLSKNSVWVDIMSKRIIALLRSRGGSGTITTLIIAIDHMLPFLFGQN